MIHGPYNIKLITQCGKPEEKTAWRGAARFVLIKKYYLSDQIKKTGIGGSCGTCGTQESFIRVLVGRSEGKGPHS